MPAEPGLVIGSGRPRVPGSAAVSYWREPKLCDSLAEKTCPPIPSRGAAQVGFGPWERTTYGYRMDRISWIVNYGPT